MAAEEADEAFKKRGVKTFTVRTDIAFHSPMLKELIEPLLATLRDLTATCTERGALMATGTRNLFTAVPQEGVDQSCSWDGFRAMQRTAAREWLGAIIQMSFVDDSLGTGHVSALAKQSVFINIVRPSRVEHTCFDCSPGGPMHPGGPREGLPAPAGKPPCGSGQRTALMQICMI